MPRAQRSWVWRYFTLVESPSGSSFKVIGGNCQLCPSKRFVKSEGTTSNLIKHLKYSHHVSKTQNEEEEDDPRPTPAPPVVNYQPQAGTSGTMNTLDRLVIRTSRATTGTANSAGTSGEPTHPRTSAERPGPSVERPGTSVERPGPSVERPEPSTVHPGPSTVHPGPSTEHPTGSTDSSTRRLPSSRNQTLHECNSRQSSYQPGGARYQEIEDALLFMIVADKMPTSTVQKRGFKHFMHVVCKAFKIPSRATVMRRLEKKYAHLKGKMSNVLNKAKKLVCTGDIWTDSAKTQSFFGLTSHFIDKMAHDMNTIRSVKLGIFELKDAHTGENIFQKLVQILADWNIPKEKIMMFVTDHAANMISGIEKLLGKGKHLGCLGHKINLMVQTAIEKTTEVNVVITKMKKIVTWFRRSVKGTDELRKAQAASNPDAEVQEDPVLRLIQDVITRWNSSYYMIERFLRLHRYVKQVLQRREKQNDEDQVEDLEPAEIEAAEDFLEVLRPFERATKETSGNTYVTLSRVIPLMHNLRERVQGTQPKTKAGERLQTKLLQQFDERMDKMEYNPFYAVSTILDPRFKRTYFQSPIACSEALNIIKLKMKPLQRNNSIVVEEPPQPEEEADKYSLWANHKEKVRVNSDTRTEPSLGFPLELRSYLDQPVIDLSEDPIKYWQQLETVYPVLSQIAQDYHAAVACSTPSERLFSDAGNIISPSRNRLTPSNAQILLFLGSLSLEEWNM